MFHGRFQNCGRQAMMEWEAAENTWAAECDGKCEGPNELSARSGVL